LSNVPNSGYALSSYSVTSGGTAVSVSNGTFVMPNGNVTITGVFAQASAVTTLAYGAAEISFAAGIYNIKVSGDQTRQLLFGVKSGSPNGTSVVFTIATTAGTFLPNEQFCSDVVSPFGIKPPSWIGTQTQSAGKFENNGEATLTVNAGFEINLKYDW